ncbi:GNAT family N-acetyltransferase [Phytomonospora sp. NPDC050363]|uniref:GNAT family N-acetyltransferase n=1 Tax=Phytomonospora sp. NPDC050363 TaxID=3155642 RepID=UPI0033C5C934
MPSVKSDVVDVVRFHPSDVTMGDEVYAGWRDAQLNDFPDQTPLDRASIQSLLENPPHGWTGEFYAATVDGRIAGAVLLFLPGLDNTHLAHVEGWVHVGSRRQGVGRALYERTLERLPELGRTTLIVRIHDRADIDPPAAGPRFAEAVGMSCAMTEVQRRQYLDEVDDGVFAAMLADCWERAEGYEVVRWTDGADGPTPEEHVDDLSQLLVRLDTDAPHGDLRIEAREPDPEAVRALDHRNRAAGIRLVHTGVRHVASGRIVAWTTISTLPSDRGHGQQQITVVDPGHRGRRLGTLAKLENLAYARRVEPGLRLVETCNADENAHMIAINETLGYRVHGRVHNFQKEI